MRRADEAVLARKILPDYLLLINDHDTVHTLIKQPDKLGVRVFLFNEGLSKNRFEQLGAPRKIFKNWLGQLLPNDRQAGYLLGKTLIAKAREKSLPFGKMSKIDMIALNGAYQTNSSEQRHYDWRC